MGFDPVNHRLLVKKIITFGLSVDVNSRILLQRRTVRYRTPKVTRPHLECCVAE